LIDAAAVQAQFFAKRRPVERIAMSSHRRLKLSVLSLAGLAIVLFCFAGERGVPAQNGILNFGQVNDHLYRGAEPDTVAVQNLARLGVKTIVDLRTGKEVRAPEAAEAAAAGILYTNIPLKGLGRPTDAQITKALAVIETSSGPVFVHCEHGCDRTGTVIACYRIRHDQLSGEAAQTEADHYGMSGLERGMRSFIADFAKAAVKK
jgi:tyrosine-protein phosphatase SIW14